jgi:fatty-acyl-CoA synthase
LRKQAEKYPNNDFQVFYQHDVRYTFQEFDQRVDEVAKGLLALGLQKGDRVGMYAPNRPEWALVEYACMRADLILVNVNPAFQEHDLDYALNLVEVKALVMAESFSKSNYVDIVRALVPDIGKDESSTVKSDVLPHLEKVIV